MSLLTIVQDAMVLCGLESPSSAYANTDPTVQQFVTHARMDGESLMRDYEWKELLVEASMTGDGTSETFTLPSDFDRWPAGQVFFRNNNMTYFYRHVSTEQMSYIKASTVRPIFPVWRMIGSTIEFHPALSNGEVVKSSYISGFWVISSDLTTRKIRWTVDTDTTLIPERLITLGAIWRWKKEKGLPFADDLAIQQMEIQKVIGQQSGSETLNLGEPIAWYDVFPTFTVSAGS